MVDTHCHILPGLDDGPVDIETSIAMARIAAGDGIRVIVATPHTDPDTGLPDPGAIRERVRALNEAIHEEALDLRIVPGAEIQLSGDLPGHAEAGDVMTVGDFGKHLLIELPFTGYPSFAPDMFFELQLRGFTPIVAHPERSSAAHADLNFIRGLAARGALLQVNVESLIGYEGRRVRNIAQTLLREGLVSLLGSDGHDTEIRPPRLSAARRALPRRDRARLMEELTLTNPARLLGL